MQIPMALRRVKPGAAHLAHPCHNAEWVTSLMPDALPQMRIWLRAVDYAHRHGGPNFAEWTAAHVLQIPGRESQIAAFLSDIKDWVRASRSGGENPFGGEGGNGHQFITRPFQSTMSLRSVSKLSDEWHEAVASNMSGPQYASPVPWLPAATINGVDIVPIDSSADLYEERAQSPLRRDLCRGDEERHLLPLQRSSRWGAGGNSGIDPQRQPGASRSAQRSVQRRSAERDRCGGDTLVTNADQPAAQIAHRAYHPEEELPDFF